MHPHRLVLPRSSRALLVVFLASLQASRTVLRATSTPRDLVWRSRSSHAHVHSARIAALLARLAVRQADIVPPVAWAPRTAAALRPRQTRCGLGEVPVHKARLCLWWLGCHGMPPAGVPIQGHVSPLESKRGGQGCSPGTALRWEEFGAAGPASGRLPLDGRGARGRPLEEQVEPLQGCHEAVFGQPRRIIQAPLAGSGPQGNSLVWVGRKLQILPVEPSERLSEPALLHGQRRDHALLVADSVRESNHGRLSEGLQVSWGDVLVLPRLGLHWGMSATGELELAL
mmetsp:Transcript_600/g.2299  ORF Transcript_600/g.2299 Transcript_600/m.2299 type:complete len:285 (-) Transcript_600:1426-2280(-)